MFIPSRPPPNFSPLRTQVRHAVCASNPYPSAAVHVATPGGVGRPHAPSIPGARVVAAKPQNCDGDAAGRRSHDDVEIAPAVGGGRGWGMGGRGGAAAVYPAKAVPDAEGAVLLRRGGKVGWRADGGAGHSEGVCGIIASMRYSWEKNK